MVKPNWQTTYKQIFNAPSVVITPQCVLKPTTGLEIFYTIVNQVSLPTFLVVGADSSVTLPSADTANQGTSFVVEYQCEALQDGVSVAGPVSFQANGELLQEIILSVSPDMELNYDVTTGDGGQLIDPVCVADPDYGYSIGYSVTNKEFLPNPVTVYSTGEVWLAGDSDV